ncbi:MAG: hypothetical protein ICV72_10420, partial [Aldersonia sp.]|nr:hypothetical protein [Aldersonia sp.]
CRRCRRSGAAQWRAWNCVGHRRAAARTVVARHCACLHNDVLDTGPGDRPALSSGAVYVPDGMPPQGGWPVVSWAHGTVGMGDQCAPSNYKSTERDSAYLAHWMQQGYAVVATDYVGLGNPGVHPYLDGPAAARSVVDMVRAARTQVPQLSSEWR